MRWSSLSEWLHWQESLHPQAIDLGLERPGAVMARMGLPSPLATVVFTVAGTNGKGSTVALLESILLAAGYRVGSYTSPHLFRYNERIRINGSEASDQALCSAFEYVNRARGEISLSYFEFGTLAAFHIFACAGLDAVVLEVGMGGRLDAVNLIDADVAIVTPIDVDHGEWLGSDREAIAREKAGIFRSNRPVVCADRQPPASLEQEAVRLGAKLYRIECEFTLGVEGERWWWAGARRRYNDLPVPALRGRSQPCNAAGVLMALELMSQQLPVTQGEVQQGLLSASLPGRFQVIPGAVTRIFDVGHNPHAARELASNLGAMPVRGRTLAVWAMLADKDAEGVVDALHDAIDVWHLAGLRGPRGRSATSLSSALAGAGITATRVHESVAQANEAALAEAEPGERVVVFGSFYTVAEAFAAPL